MITDLLKPEQRFLSYPFSTVEYRLWFPQPDEDSLTGLRAKNVFDVVATGDVGVSVVNGKQCFDVCEIAALRTRKTVEVRHRV
ncbi:MAG: hypothetical protein KDA63_00560 [Planctomycetales bacterium]|nr:hypothetical protein [Planctomycetales bacterium]